MRLILVVAVAMFLSSLGCSSAQDDLHNTRKETTKQEQAIAESRLPFLANIPEFHELDLTITEDALAALITENGLLVKITKNESSKTYHIYRQDGENVIVMFKEGKCSGIQKMRRDPLGVPKSNDIKSLERHVRVQVGLKPESTRRYRYQEVDATEVHRLLEHPQGTLPVQRPGTSQEQLDAILSPFRKDYP